jgi:hypothetical protein
VENVGVLAGVHAASGSVQKRWGRRRRVQA